jgi:hypothetical protein
VVRQVSLLHVWFVAYLRNLSFSPPLCRDLSLSPLLDHPKVPYQRSFRSHAKAKLGWEARIGIASSTRSNYNKSIKGFCISYRLHYTLPSYLKNGTIIVPRRKLQRRVLDPRCASILPDPSHWQYSLHTRASRRLLFSNSFLPTGQVLVLEP